MDDDVDAKPNTPSEGTLQPSEPMEIDSKPTTRAASPVNETPTDQPPQTSPTTRRARPNTRSDDDDEVVAEYDLFITAPIREQVLLFQYPNRDRDQPYNTSDEQPRELRIKSKAGFVEMDIAQQATDATMDRDKLARWADALSLARERKVDQFGLATGFGKALKPSEQAALLGSDAKNGKGRGKANEDSGMGGGIGEPALPTRKENIQTLGGQIIRPDTGQPIYMQGVFRGNQVHLTPLAGYVQMRPQFHHLDASARQEAMLASRALSGANGAAPNADRITMTMQVARAQGETEEEISIQKTAELLIRVADEPWSRLQYFNEDSTEAYEAYDSRCFLKNANEGKMKLENARDEFEYLGKVSGVEVKGISGGGKGTKRTSTVAAK